MRHSNAIGFLAAIVLLLMPIAAVANMPPPEPYKLGIAGKMNNDGLLLTSVEKGSKAAEFGLKPGDVILGADRRCAKSLSPSELKELINGLHHWQTQLIVLRGGRDVLIIDIRA